MRKRIIRSSEAHKAHSSGTNGFFEVKTFKLMYGYLTSKKLDDRLVQGPSVFSKISAGGIIVFLRLFFQKIDFEIYFFSDFR